MAKLRPLTREMLERWVDAMAPVLAEMQKTETPQWVVSRVAEGVTQTERLLGDLLVRERRSPRSPKSS